jgi:hypothetical protein
MYNDDVHFLLFIMELFVKYDVVESNLFLKVFCTLRSLLSVM